ncbi:transcription termination factor MTEF1, chloroplastic-like [Musa acuminata AAA Group]|uniref:transcription termination factor MTEF1, chloroplastic-like n=1 Tax=Musa acuminata AAA Group TaxID=214697 RepID=UPI0031D778CC
MGNNCLLHGAVGYMVIHPQFVPSCSNCNMPLLHSLCASSSLILPTTTAAAAQLAAKPSVLSPAPSSSSKDFAVPIPGLPTHVKEKILILEVMGVDAGRALSLNPALRTASLDSVHSVIAYLLSKGIHHKDLGRILGMCPRILTSSVRADLGPVFAFISRDLGVPDSGFRRVINKCPRLLASSVGDQLKPALDYLRRLGFTDTNALAYHDPVLLVSSVEKTLIPKLQYLVGLGMSREEAVGMVLRCPGLFTFSIDRNFKPKYEYLIGQMGRSLQDLKDFPQYFAFSLEKRIKRRHQELRHSGLTLPLSTMLKSTDEELKQLVEKKKKNTRIPI